MVTRTFKKRTPFQTRKVGNLIEVWLPPMDHGEGELVLKIDESYVPALIAALRSHQPRKQ